MRMESFNEFVDWLNACTAPRLCLDEVTARLQQTQITLADVERNVVFSEERYQRNLHVLGPKYYALLLCWLPGQASPIHDHRGASCSIKVIQGNFTEQRYRPTTAGPLELIQETRVTEGSVCGSQDDDIHRITNLDDIPLVTLHIYSPYLSNFNIYDEATGERQVFCDPLVEANAAKQQEMRSAGNPL